MVYKVTLTRYVEHETIYKVKADSEDEAIELALSGDYTEIVHDTELGELEDPKVIDIEES